MVSFVSFTRNARCRHLVIHCAVRAALLQCRTLSQQSLPRVRKSPVRSKQARHATGHTLHAYRALLQVRIVQAEAFTCSGISAAAVPLRRPQ